MKICHLSLPVLVPAVLDDSSTLLSLKGRSGVETGVNHLLSAVGHRNVTQMESLLQGLVEEAVQEPAWKFDDDIQAALHSIRDMFVKSIQTALKDQHREDQEDMNCFTQSCFGGCFDAYDDSIAQCDIVSAKCDGLGSQHVECRHTVKTSYTGMAQKCAQLHSFINGWVDEPCLTESCLCPDLNHCHTKLDGTCEPYQGDCKSGYGRWLQQMAEKYESGYEQWLGLYTQCKTSYHEFLTLDMECDATQKGFEQCLCEKNRCHWTSCNVELDQCHAQCWGKYGEKVREKECLEKDRKIDWSATKKIECYIDILLHDYTKEELLSKCGSEDCINTAREEDYKHCSTICPNVDHDGLWPTVVSVDNVVTIDGHEKRASQDQYLLGDSEFLCDYNGDAVFTKHRGAASRADEGRCTEHLDIDYQIPLCTECRPQPPPVCDAAFHKKWYFQFDDTAKVAEISDCCPLTDGAHCFPDVTMDTSADGVSMSDMKVTEHSHAWAFNRCPCQECVGGYPTYEPRPEGQTCGNGAHTLDTALVPGWKLVFRETYPFMFTPGEWSREPQNPEALNFAILDQLESFRGDDDKFEFKMSWPGADLEDQIWKQSSNPVTKTSQGVDGYEAISAPHTSKRWGGLEHGGRSSLLDGSVNHNNWFYSVGSFRPWSNGIPGPKNSVQVVELYTRAMVEPTRAPVKEKTWHLVTRNTAPQWFSPFQWRVNEEDPSSANYAILDKLEEFREDGRFEFKLVWPGSGLEDQHWSQTTNPVTVTTAIQGYKAINAPHSSNRWGGLEHGGTYSLLDGSVNHGNWFYSVGSFRQWSTGIPGPSKAVNQVELYVKSSLSASDVASLYKTEKVAPEKMCPANVPESDRAPVYAGDGTSKCYFVNRHLGDDINAGRSWCEAHGGELASIHSNADNNAVLQILRGASAYIGALGTECPDQHTLCTWTWEDGSQWAPITWATDGLNHNNFRLHETRIAVHSDKRWHDWVHGQSNKGVVCQIKTGTWRLVVRQTNGFWFQKNQWSLNPGDPNNDNYAILDQLESFRRHGEFEFKLVWPKDRVTDQHWSQTSNPVTKQSRGVEGYRAISAPHTSQHWRGLEYNNGNSLLDGSVNHGNWFYAVGSTRKWSSGIPGPSKAVNQVELWVKA